MPDTTTRDNKKNIKRYSIELPSNEFVDKKFIPIRMKYIENLEN